MFFTGLVKTYLDGGADLNKWIDWIATITYGTLAEHLGWPVFMKTLRLNLFNLFSTYSNMAGPKM